MIYFLRHGLDDERYIGGWSDVDLIDEGIKQVNETVDEIIKLNICFDKVIVSDVKRAISTAEILKRRDIIEEYQISELFKEQNKGILNGMDKKRAETEYPMFTSKDIKTDTIYPKGESLFDLYKRISDIMEYIMSLPNNTLIITHRGVINMIYFIINDIELNMNKEQFDVTHASLHEYDKRLKKIRRVI